MKMKSIFGILILLSFFGNSFATGQSGDILVWKNDTLKLFSNPLESKNDFQILRTKLFGNQDGGFNTGCWRGYVAEWTTIENELFLTNIYSCDYYSDRIKADLKKLFGDECIDNKVKASWVNEELRIPLGKCIIYIHDGYSSYYEKEIALNIKNGIVVDYEEFDNSKTYKSIFKDDDSLLRKFIFGNIKWNKIPFLDTKKIRVYVSLTSSDTKKPDVELYQRVEDDLFNSEAIRVANLIPEWDVYYRRGKLQRLQYTIRFEFSEENRKKYAQ